MATDSHLEGQQQADLRSAHHHDPATSHVLFARLAQISKR